MNIILCSDNMRRSLTISLRGWRTPVALLVIIFVIAFSVYKGAQNIAERWVVNEDAVIISLIEAHRANIENEKTEIWNATVKRLDQEVTNLNVELWRLSNLGNKVAETMGMEEDVLVDTYTFPFVSPTLEGDSIDEKLGNLESKVINFNNQLQVESLRVNELASEASYSRMLRETIPFRRPVEGRFWLTSGYGTRTDPFTGRKAFHAGYDYAARTGTPILAGADGIVTHRGRLGNYGKTIEVYHGDEISTLYGHLSAYKVEVGEFVKRGQVIALMGSTGRSTGPHLHYEVRKEGRPKPYTRTFKELVAARPSIAALPSPENL